MKTITRSVPSTEMQARTSLEKEIEALRAIIKVVQDSLSMGEGDLAKTGALVARLTDSLGRALLVQQKLSANNSLIMQAERELADLLRQWKEMDED